MWSLLFSLKKVFAKNTIILINLSFSLQLFSCFQSTTPLNSQPTQTSLVAKLQNLCQKVDQVIFKLLKRAPLFVENYLLILYLRQNVQNNQYRSYFPSVDLGILEMANGRQYRNANHIIYHMIYAYQSSSLNYLGKALKIPPLFPIPILAPSPLLAMSGPLKGWCPWPASGQPCLQGWGGGKDDSQSINQSKRMILNRPCVTSHPKMSSDQMV